ncbi:class I SAM-dependent methyltransferase [Rhodocytophaga rosea]|uniref:Class I SAM-dependent methyltransferase n=1 Tax=Rhodocytophaga rosea TaxID=2704465 RepID=A0A6C0GCL5_9BACT|nr:class I SAM-dependent methyltransferase [Rhodocytophaga rosea]QHT65711.1 class I SAM-dependent methyltransferase [Rhodocytophaga rosea]
MNNPVSKTAYYTLACRFWDSKKTNPVCNDTFAHIFMNEDAQEVAERFKTFEKPNASIVVRHRIMSELVDQQLIHNPSLHIFNIGCGFDTRPFRHTAGKWIEVDEPAVITNKNELLPSSQTKNELTRIPVEFSRESLKEKLLPFKTSDQVVVIAEGVTMYLEETQQHIFLHTLKELFPRHLLICDVMTLSFFKKYSQELSTQINSLGAHFKGLSDKPEAIYHASGYQTKKRISATLRSAELGTVNIPSWLIRYFFPTLRDGLCVYEFQYGKD